MARATKQSTPAQRSTPRLLDCFNCIISFNHHNVKSYIVQQTNWREVSKTRLILLRAHEVMLLYGYFSQYIYSDA